MSNPLTNLNFNIEQRLSAADVRELLSHVEERMQASSAKLEVPVEHHFSKGVYAREMRVPAGTLLMGKIHKFQNLNILSAGEVSVLSIDGVRRVKAPYTFVASPGAKRLFYMHEDTVWTTIHGTDETNVDLIEAEFIAKSYEDVYLAGSRTFQEALAITGFLPEELTAISENKDDQVPFPNAPAVEVKESPIHGSGLFATDAFRAHEMIATALINGKRTPAGRYTNHSGRPNAEMIRFDEQTVYLVATASIAPGDEITTDYYFTFKTMRGPK